MSGASTLHTQLLHQAEHLAHKEPKKPRQASLRRSISASYYAVYHFLARQAARSMVGSSKNLEELRHLFRRSFEHRTMKSVCTSFSSGRGALPDQIAEALRPSAVPDELRTFARHFVDLQAARHQADYDLATKFYRQDAVDNWEKARECIKTLWPSVRGSDVERYFLVSLHSWRGMKR